MMMTVRPCIARSRACLTRASLALSRALVASSSRSTAGFCIRARAMATRCFCPPLSCTPRSPTPVRYLLGSVMMKSCALAVRAAASTSSGVGL
mmetsp:Transcript_81376/g.218822  ORF Transcript_81376/g.218822 Transcript_81376/m.218822 type:complete len:93 (+) Transcript_81376:174-452(+)